VAWQASSSQRRARIATVSAQPISNAQADRAGQLLREARLESERPSTEAELAGARETVEGFRLRFLEPHLAVAERLERTVDVHEPDIAVTARLKRYERIGDKLVRHPRMRLSQMQDIGGCRAVLPARLDGSPGASGIDALRKIADEIRQSWPILAEDDYIARPRDTGYRALHLVVREGGVAIEVQLRTFRQDQWAELVETTARDTGLRLADGEGPDDLLELIRIASEIYAVNDGGQPAPRVLMSEFERLLPVFRSILKSKPPETEA